LEVVVRPKEEAAKLEKRAREELEQLEKYYTQNKPYLSEGGERACRRQIEEAEQKVKALSQSQRTSQ
jgi:hypothetical protein